MTFATVSSDLRINSGLLWLTVIPGLPLLVYLLRDVSFIVGLLVFALLPVLYIVIQRFTSGIDLDDLEKRAVFITGCDTGFGNLLALKCLGRGIPVFAGCLTEQGAEDLRTAAKNLPGYLDTVLVNVASTESVAAAAKYLDEATAKYGGLHAIVNNAGVFGSTFFDDFLNVEQYKEIAEVNTFGVIRVTQAMKHLVKQTRGRVVTISSAAARVGAINTGPYTMSKFAVSGYCEVIRQELKYFGVSVHVLEPGIFNTPMAAVQNINKRLDDMWSKAPAARKKEYGEGFYQESKAWLLRSIGKQTNPNVNVVVDAYFHAITSRFPHLRYQLGPDCQFLYLPLSYMPTGLRDAIFTVLEMMDGVPVPQCTPQRAVDVSRKNA